MTAPEKYLAAVRAVLAHLEKTQLPAVDRAADLVVHALTHRGAVWCSEIGHGIQGDFVNRAGGLAAVQAFSFLFTVNDKTAACLQGRPSPAPAERDLEAVRLAARSSNLRAGDVMLLGSVSGKNRAPVELARVCRELGVRTIGLTSLEASRRAKSLHPSGQRLFEVVDVVLDHGAPEGDAAVEIPGYTTKALPVSGFACAVLGHMLWGRVMEKMAAAQTPATVFLSVNREGGPEHHRQMIEQFEKRGY